MLKGEFIHQLAHRERHSIRNDKTPTSSWWNSLSRVHPPDRPHWPWTGASSPTDPLPQSLSAQLVKTINQSMDNALNTKSFLTVWIYSLSRLNSLLQLNSKRRKEKKRKEKCKLITSQLSYTSIGHQLMFDPFFFGHLSSSCPSGPAPSRWTRGLCSLAWPWLHCGPWTDRPPRGGPRLLWGRNSPPTRPSEGNGEEKMKILSTPSYDCCSVQTSFFPFWIVTVLKLQEYLCHESRFWGRCTGTSFQSQHQLVTAV